MNGISVVIPMYNEEENAALAYAEVTKVLLGMNRPYELIFVDDGSRDKTVEILETAGKDDPNLRVIQLRRNFGQTAAMAAGFEYAKYEIVACLDGDLQNDPAELPRMVAALEEGNDLVAGWRKDRKDKFISRKLPSMIANYLISRSTKVKLHDYGCTLKVMTSDIAKNLKLYGEMHRFIPALASEIGAKVVEIPVNHRERQFGTSKYGISRTFRVILDLLTVKFLLGYAKRPIHLFGSVGLASSLIGFLTLGYITFQRMFMSVPMGNRPLLSLGVMMVLIGLQFLVFGLLAELLARTYYESQGKKTYFVRKIFQSKQPSETTPIRAKFG